MLCSLFSVAYFAEAQESKSVYTIARTITKYDLKKHLEIIAHDTLQGRETGKEGQKKAARYLQSQFERIGLSPLNINGEQTYFQTFQLFTRKWGDISITVNNVNYENMKDILFLTTNTEKTEKRINVMFAGYGESEEFQHISHDNKGVILIYPDSEITREEKISTARNFGIEDIFFIYGDKDEDLKEQIGMSKKLFRSDRLKLERDPINAEGHVFYIPPSLAEQIFQKNMQELLKAAEKSKKGKTKALDKIPEGHLSFRVENLQEEIETENVVGYVEGSERPEEVLVISAHYDHVGIKEDGIYNGADDNGSGTSAVLEIAEAFSLARKMGLGPKRSVLFILLTGEEKGLLGSNFYVNNPIFPLDNTIVNFNIDMIGRIDRKYVDNADYVYLIGSDKISKELHRISERTNIEKIGLKLDYTYNDDKDPNRFYYRSDHYNFAKNGIPAIFYFTGVHDDYHKETDEVDKILFDRMERITKLVFFTAWEIANMDRRLEKE